MRVLVTRPEREAQEWVHALGQTGCEAQALPLIAIAPVSDAQPLQQAWRQLQSWQAVMFVSAYAVDAFFAARPADAPEFATASVRAWATGPGTVKALQRAGAPAGCIDAPPAHAAQFDSEALWGLVGATVTAGSRVLVVRGADASASPQGAGRDWFAAQVSQAGGHVEFVASYRRLRPELSAAQQQRAHEAAADGTIWLFSSSEAVRNLQSCLPQQDWRRARALATHARIAQAARAAGFGVVRESRPILADVCASIESMR